VNVLNCREESVLPARASGAGRSYPGGIRPLALPVGAVTDRDAHETGTGEGTPDEVALWKQMSKSSPSRPFPVTVIHLPVTRCQVCHRTVAYRPGTISEALTEHYRRAHPEALGLASR